ncbi:MAG TPA: hypothetical protein VH369_09260 [Bryobacteraceae bacterium]|jgi:hypothetical protein
MSDQATSVAAVYYPPNNQLEVFFADSTGALAVIWKAQNGAWNAPHRLTTAGFTLPGSPIAAVFYPLNNQLEVFIVDAEGALTLFWKAQNGVWQQPFRLTGPRFAPAGAPVSAAYYPLNNQLEIFLFDAQGAFNVVWKAQNGAWHPAFRLTPAEVASTGTPLTAVYYPPNNQLEVFHVDSHGALKVIWKAQNGAWNQPFALTGPGFTAPSAPLSAAFYRVNSQLEVFSINPHGALTLMWKAQNGAWQNPVNLTPDGYAIPGTPPIAVYHPPDEHLEVLFADTVRSMNVVWKANNGHWQGPVSITRPEYLGTGVNWAAVHYPLENQLEVFTPNPAQVLFVEWKAGNQFWAPCPFPLRAFPSGPPAPATLMETIRIAQLTGTRDPEGKPIINDSNLWSVAGTDLGANTDHNGRVFFFFGDVPRAGRVVGPPQDADLVAYSEDAAVGPNGIKLNAVMDGEWFHPYTVAAPFGIPGTNRTPTGAFSFGGRAYVFAVVNDPDDPGALPKSILTSSDHPEMPGEYRIEFEFDHFRFWQVAPIVVNNSSLPDLPLPSGPGLILFGHGDPGAIHLAWMPLPITTRGRVPPAGIRYYTGITRNPWSLNAADATILVKHEPYTAVSAAWITGANLWVLMHSNAAPADAKTPFAITGPIMARLGPLPWQLSAEVEVFNPCRERAYGRYMHWPGADTFAASIPPNLGDHPGWAYGAFLINRFCRWEAHSRVLTLHYLLSLSIPYQPQLIQSRVRIA